MNCESLPKQGEPDLLCMEHPSYSEDGHSASGSGDSYGGGAVGGTKKKPHGSQNSGSQKKCPKGDRKCQQSQQEKKDCACKCRYPLVQLGKDSIWFNTTVAKVGSVNNCGIPCRGEIKLRNF